MEVLGTTLGSCVINDQLILFTTREDSDRIYKIKPPNSTGESESILLFNGDLNFSKDNKIKTLPFYENEFVQKVYWIDGRNQPRVINIAVEDESIWKYTNTSFDFIQDLKLEESVAITKQYGGGSFKSGVIQYAFTYFNKNGAESNIFKITPINYISPVDRGGKPDETIQNTFKINISNLESKYQYVRIYSIYRTSLDSTPEVKNIVDISVNEQRSISYIDTGTNGSIVSSDFLLYVGGEEVIPNCISQKNNTLFLGDITLKSSIATNASMNDVVSNEDKLFSWVDSSPTTIEAISNSDTSYPYKPSSLSSNGGVAHFKYDECYRLGIQGQYSNGRWSAPIWLGSDKKVNKRYHTFYGANNQSVMLTYVNGSYSPSIEAITWMKSIGFLKVRPVIVPISYSDRTIIAQGLVNNTLGIMKNRLPGNVGSSVFAFPDYIFRPNSKKHQPSTKTYDGVYAHMDILKINNGLHPYNQSQKVPSKYIENMAVWDTVDYHDAYDTAGFSNPINNDFDREFIFVDRNIVNFWSPEIEYNPELINQYSDSVDSAALYGFAFMTGYSYNFSLDSGRINDFTNESSVNGGRPNYFNGANSIESEFRKTIFSHVNDDNTANSVTFPLWSPERYITSTGSEVVGDYDITFTKSNKSGFSYFGINRNLNGDKILYSINSPKVLFNDSTVFYKTNIVDSQGSNGSVLYSKSFSKGYAGGSYENIVAPGNDTFRFAKVKSPLSVKYNTANHGLFSFKEIDSMSKCMPRLKNIEDTLSTDIYLNTSESWYRGGGLIKTFRADVVDRSLLKYSIPSSDNSSKNSLPIFDLYTNVSNDPSSQDYTKYGGNSADALYSNSWIPCGDPVIVADNMVVLYTDGDTYINRYDTLRVFPSDLNQIPQHTEIISFLCESFINIDGRSDVNRYNTDSSLMTKSNYGLLNNIYSQKNNYFNYNILDPLLFKSNTFSNTITWTKSKVSGEITDNWTSISMLSTIDLDGVYGRVSSINLFNNELYAFQPFGIARLLYNERVQQQASDGVSVELANGYKVPDYRYVTNQYGCSNAESIVEGKGGIYFIDYKNKSFNSLTSEGIRDLSLTAGFKSWFNENSANSNYVLSYDRLMNDIYIHNDQLCLNYSEILGSFASFYDYKSMTKMINAWDRFLSISGEIGSGGLASKVWMNNSGEYNSFYGITRPFSIEYILNPDPQLDKVFNLVEYRLDNQDIDWTNISLSNWYQEGSYNPAQYKSKMKRRFNVNRIHLPRQSNSNNRIRSTWLKLKMENTPGHTNNNNKFEMQDLTLSYTI